MTSPPHDTDTLRPFHGGFLQFSPIAGDIQANLARVRTILAGRELHGATLIVLPELWATDFAYDKLASLAPEIPALIGSLIDLCRSYAKNPANPVELFLAGALPELAVDEPASPAYDTLFLTGPQGLIGKYRKQKLFLPTGEDRYFTAGQGTQQVISSPLGKIAGLVCFDLRFPELARRQVADGAQLLMVSGQWPLARLDHWRTLVKARAIENQVYTIACNRCGHSGELQFGGHSMIVAPDGIVLEEAGENIETAMVTEISPERIAAFRKFINTQP